MTNIILPVKIKLPHLLKNRTKIVLDYIIKTQKETMINKTIVLIKFPSNLLYIPWQKRTFVINIEGQIDFIPLQPEIFENDNLKRSILSKLFLFDF